MTLKLAFLTMVWRDYWLLEKWVAHNARMVPKRQLYVVNHGGDPKIDEIAAGCNVIHMPRDEITPDLTRRRWDLVGGMTNGLLAFHDMVVCTDVDEFLVYAGNKPGLVDHLASIIVTGAAVSPIGLNVVPDDNDPQDPELPVLARHRNAMVHAKYTKPCIAAKRVVYTVGGHGLVRGSFQIDPEILLFHLHYVTPDYQERMAARVEITQQSIAQNEAADAPMDMPKRHWINWANPERIRNKDLGNFAKAELLDVSAGFDECAAVLRAAIVSDGKKVVVDPSKVNENPKRIVVPKRLQGAI